MKRFFQTLAIGTGLIALTFLGSASAAESSNTRYAIAMTALYGSSSPYTGALDLDVNPSGIVRGYYFPADGSSLYVPVVGGKTGSTIWLDIGSTQITHVNGRLQDGNIVGTAFTSANDQYTFVARPTAVPIP